MIKTNFLGARSIMNPSSEVLINNYNFFIYEHQYVEFDEKYSVEKIQRERDNANTLYYFLEGDSYLEIGDKRISVKAGDVVFLPLNKRSSYRVVMNPGVKKAVVSFYFNIFNYEDIFAKFYDPIIFEDTHGYGKKIKDAIVSNTTSSNILLKSLVILSLSPLLEKVDEEISESLMKGMQYSTLFEYIDSHLFLDLSLNEISKCTGHSVSYLTHTFSKNLGFSIKNYIQKSILRHVSLDLAYTELRLKDIAYKYHFGSESYFSQWFYAKNKIRPYDYRKIFKGFQEYKLYNK